MNRQEAFDKAYLGVVAQGCQSVTDTRLSCAYRGRDGAKCAVGHLLTDEQIARHAVRNNSSADQLPPDVIKELLPDDDDAIDFLVELQGVHDGNYYVDGYVGGFKRTAARFAERWNLTVPEVA